MHLEGTNISALNQHELQNYHSGCLDDLLGEHSQMEGSTRARKHLPHNKNAGEVLCSCFTQDLLGSATADLLHLSIWSWTLTANAGA